MKGMERVNGMKGMNGMKRVFGFLVLALSASVGLHAQVPYFKGSLTGAGTCALNSGNGSCSDADFTVTMPHGLDTDGPIGTGSLNLAQTGINTGTIQFVNKDPETNTYVPNTGLGTATITASADTKTGPATGTLAYNFTGVNYKGDITLNYTKQACTGTCSHIALTITSSLIEFVGVSQAVLPSPPPQDASCYTVHFDLIWEGGFWPFNGWWAGSYTTDDCNGSIAYTNKWFPVDVSPTCPNGAPPGKCP